MDHGHVLFTLREITVAVNPYGTSNHSKCIPHALAIRVIMITGLNHVFTLSSGRLHYAHECSLPSHHASRSTLQCLPGTTHPPRSRTCAVGTEPCDRVTIGDVGYVMDGFFHRMFNVTLSWDDPSNQRHGVPPQRYEPLDIGPLPNVRKAILTKGCHYSRNVHSQANLYDTSAMESSK